MQIQWKWTLICLINEKQNQGETSWRSQNFVIFLQVKCFPSVWQIHTIFIKEYLIQTIYKSYSLIPKAIATLQPPEWLLTAVQHSDPHCFNFINSYSPSQIWSKFLLLEFLRYPTVVSIKIHKYKIKHIPKNKDILENSRYESTVSYTRLVLTHILSFPRYLYFSEYVLFYTFLSCRLVVVFKNP